VPSPGPHSPYRRLLPLATQAGDDDEQLWTYSSFLDAYLQLGNWEAPVSDAKNKPSRAHKRLVMEMPAELVRP
jgi:hypothetical protein